MCISYVHYAPFLIRWKIFIVQCSYAPAALLGSLLNISKSSPIFATSEARMRPIDQHGLEHVGQSE